MKSKAVITAVIAASMVLAMAVGVQARPFGPSSGDRGIEPRLWGLKALLELKLTDEQQGQVLNIINKYEDQRAGLRSRMAKAGKDVAAALRAGTFNEENARKAFREASAVREDIFILRARMMSELKAVLTPEQVQLLQERRSQRHEKIRDFHAQPENPNE
jgi:Spy/CpxP family protein refolding chaperone